MQKARVLTCCLISALLAPLTAHAQQWTGRFSEPVHITYSAIVEESTLTAIRRAEREGGTVSGGFFQ